MTRLKDATDRLDAAVARLDQALTLREGKALKDAQVWQTALHRAETENATAEKRDSEIADRLDSVIGRLKTIVEG